MTTTFKTYARTIDARSYIEAREELAVLSYHIEGVDIDGKRRFKPIFYVAASQVATVEKHGFEARTINDTATPEQKAEPMPEAKTLSQKAMLAELTIKGWSGRAQDNEAAAHTAQAYQANVEWMKFTKRLVNKEALKAVKKAENEARKTHKELTLPWNENGQRILPAQAYQDYMTRMAAHRDAHEAAVDAFLAEFDALVEEARKELGGLFNPADYPEAGDLLDKFLFDTELNALDVTGDFRVKMADSEMKALQEQIARRTEARLAGAMHDVYERLHDVVSHMAERLRAYKPKQGEDGKIENPFRDATLNNVRDIVDLLPKLNLTNDPALTALAQEVKQTLLAADAKELRNDDAKRADVAAQAEKIAGAMAGLM